jgi:tetratricopeptide (TPR) repeat protein
MRVWLALLLAASSAWAHYDVNVAVAALTQKIKIKPSAELYHQRAIEFRALRDQRHAESDLRAALRLNPYYQPSLAALARLLNLQGDHAAAVATAKKLVASAPEPHHQLLLADLAFDAGDQDLALRAVRQGPPSEDATLLLHSHLLYQKKEYAAAAKLLKKSHQRTQSIVLRNAWLEASILAGKGDEILPVLNEEIAASRFTASHRIRRAQVSEEHKDSDLWHALKEIESRLNPDRPDLTLIHDRRKVYLLLGDKKNAAADLAILRKNGLKPVSPWLVRTVSCADRSPK